MQKKTLEIFRRDKHCDTTDSVPSRTHTPTFLVPMKTPILYLLLIMTLSPSHIQFQYFFVCRLSTQCFLLHMMLNCRKCSTQSNQRRIECNLHLRFEGSKVPNQQTPGHSERDARDKDNGKIKACQWLSAQLLQHNATERIGQQQCDANRKVGRS